MRNLKAKRADRRTRDSDFTFNEVFKEMKLRVFHMTSISFHIYLPFLFPKEQRKSALRNMKTVPFHKGPVDCQFFRQFT